MAGKAGGVNGKPPGVGCVLARTARPGPLGRRGRHDYILPMSLHISFDNSYARLPDRFFVRQAPVPVAQPRLLALNEPLA